MSSPRTSPDILPLADYYECYVCGKKEPQIPPPIGWELHIKGKANPWGRLSFCPKHRQNGPKAFATLGDFFKK